MLTIRLARTGRKNKPMYRLVISEKSQTPTARALEYLGSYNPHTKELQVKSPERIQYWLSKGSGMSDTVNNLLISKQIIRGKKIKNSKCVKKVEAGENKGASSETKVENDTKEAPVSEGKVEKTEEVKEVTEEKK